MTPYYSDDLVTIYHGDCREVSVGLDFESVVTDPPYGTGFDGVEGDDDFPFLNAVPSGPTLAFGPARLHIQHMRHFRTPPDRVLIWAPRFSWTKASDGGVLYKWTPIYGWHLEATGHGEPAGDVFDDFEAAESSISKPVSLMRRLLPLTTGTILDPYMGKGATIVAAKERGRRAIGIEIEERYCEIAAQRCSQEVLGLA